MDYVFPALYNYYKLKVGTLLNYLYFDICVTEPK